MNDKALEYLENYEITVNNAVKGRGGAYIFTEDGIKLYLECTKADSYYIREKAVTDALVEADFPTVDTYIKNKEGGIFTEGDDGRKYILKNWFMGRDCEVKSGADMVVAASTLARLHNSLETVSKRGIVIENVVSPEENARKWDCLAGAEEEQNQENVTLKASEANCVNFCDSQRGRRVREDFKRHTAELKKAGNYMRSKKRKNEFEQVALRELEHFYDEALDATRLIDQDCIQSRFQRAEDSGELIHGSFNYHNVIMDIVGDYEHNIAVTNFERCQNECQIVDLYQFLRKVLEKHNWDVGVAYALLDEYDRVRPLEDVELELLIVLLKFPLKFWKIINQYYNSGKAWIPLKDIEKLKTVIRQNSARLDLIDKICGVC